MNLEQYKIIAEDGVKNIRLVREPTRKSMGEYIFEFIDDVALRYIGKLGVSIEHKGEANCAVAVYNFKRLERAGVRTIFCDQVASNAIRVDSTPAFPIQLIARDAITNTSSVKARLHDGSVRPGALGLDEMPLDFPVFLPKTYLDANMRIDDHNGYLTLGKLKLLAEASTSDMNLADGFARKVTTSAQQRAKKTGFLIYDHRIELVKSPRGEIMVGGVPLCLDEMTGSFVGPYNDVDDFRGKSFVVFEAGVAHDPDSYVNISKQLFKDHFAANNTAWLKQVRTERANGSGAARSVPEVPNILVSLVSNIYQAFANEWTGEKLFKVASLADCAADYKKWAMSYYKVRSV